MSPPMVRCMHCGLAHPTTEKVCPSTGRALQTAPRASERPAPPAVSAPPARAPQAAGSSSPRRELIGRTIDGKYRFRSILGEGGMGTVFEAENVALGRLVAVKVLHPAQAKKKVAVKRFHQEARAAGKIGHPNICEVYDLGTLEDGAPYLVMEKLVGATLADRISREGGLPFEDTIDIVNQVLSGLVAAHAKGIVHRDIKPENVFLTERAGCPPVVKLLDFGVSKMISPESGEELDLTRTGMVMGTPFYMSPEQARGDRNLDARVDLWACGVILYEALTGRRPFIAANYNALLLQILTAIPRPPKELRPDLPAGFNAILERAMARAREQRYQTAILFQRDLATLRATYFEPARSAHPPSPRPQVPPPPPVLAPPMPLTPDETEYAPPPSIHAAPASASDPLARLPSLEARYDEDSNTATAEDANPEHDASGTHFALDLLGSGEIEAADAPAPEPASGFDDLPTEIVRSDWDDPTTRKPLEAASALRRAAVKSKPKIPARVPPNIEDTIKIEGDIEEHFARMNQQHEAAEKPRIPRPKRPR